MEESIMVAMFSVIVAMIGVVIAATQKYRGLRDEEFERLMNRLDVWVEQLRILITKGDELQPGDGMYGVNFLSNAFLRIITDYDIKTDEDLRRVFREEKILFFSPCSDYFFSFEVLLDWVNKRRWRRTRARYAQRVVASLSRKESILIMGYGLAQYPIPMTGKKLKDYIEKYGMLYILNNEIRLFPQVEIPYRKYYEESAFVEGGWHKHKYLATRRK